MPTIVIMHSIDDITS